MKPTSNQWEQPELSTEVHRGLKEPLNASKGVGVHWSHVRGVANRFANDNATEKKRTVIHAKVPISSVETNTKILSNNRVGTLVPGDPLLEREIPVKKGAPVKVTGVTKFRGELGKRRTRTFNPPREMKA